MTQVQLSTIGPLLLIVVRTVGAYLVAAWGAELTRRNATPATGPAVAGVLAIAISLISAVPAEAAMRAAARAAPGDLQRVPGEPALHQLPGPRWLQHADGIHSEHSATRYLVATKDSPDIADLLQDNGGGRLIHTFTESNAGFVASLTRQAAARLVADPRVEAMEPEALYRFNDTQESPPWGLDRLDQRSGPRDRTYNYGNAGAGVRVYVVDSGVYRSHRDFEGRVLKGYDSLGQGETDDCTGHGSHVAGIIAGRRHGVAKRAEIVPVRVGCSTDVRAGRIIDGLEFVIRDHQAKDPAVLNMSLGGPPSAALDSAVRRVVADGVTVVVAGGNHASDACSFSPSRVADAITVGAVDPYDTIAEFSASGACIDIFAPGLGISSVGIAGRNDVRLMDGTSVSAPHVAGAAARWLSSHPRAEPADVWRALKRKSVDGHLIGLVHGDPDRLLHYAGVAPTKLTQVVADGSTEELRIRAVLRNRVSGAPLAGKEVRVEHRARGSERWHPIIVVTTGARGRIDTVLELATAGDVRLRHRRTRYSGASASAPLPVIV